MERDLAELWAEVLGRDEVGRDDNFFELGGDSILGIQLVARARDRGIKLAPRQLFEHQTVAKLAVVARRDEVAAARGPEVGPVALGPSQRWFFEENLAEPHHFNQSIALEMPPGVDADALGRALCQVVAHHDLLRSRFTLGEAAVRAEIAPPGPVELAITDLSQRPVAEQKACLEAAIASDQASLRLDRGALFAPHLFQLSPAQPATLVLTAHHLLVDGVSWRILVEDLRRAYEAEAAGATALLPARTAAYGDWVARLAAWAGSAELAAEQAGWTAVPDGPLAQLPLDEPYDADANRVGDAAECTLALSAEETAALRSSSAAAYSVNVQEVLLAALVRSLAEDGAAGVLAVDVEGHGREDVFDGVDVSRTVGWFTSVFPVHLPLGAGRDPEIALTTVKEQLRAVPHAGLGFGVLRYLSPDPAVRAQLAAAPAAQIRFNYFGQLDGGQPTGPSFGLAAQPCEPQRSPLGQRRHLLDLNAWIHDGRLAMTWTYSQRLFKPRTVEALAHRFVAALGDLARVCASATTRHYTPSDFPDVQLSQDNLDALLADIGLANEKE
jgi:non-ribosomal peptide synthase protein (TIGR01720 family)